GRKKLLGNQLDDVEAIEMGKDPGRQLWTPAEADTIGISRCCNHHSLPLLRRHHHIRYRNWIRNWTETPISSPSETAAARREKRWRARRQRRIPPRERPNQPHRFRPE